MIVTPDEGKLELWGDAFKSPLVTDTPLSVRLYSNDYTPVDGSTLADFTEAGWGGYFRETINRAGWGVPTIIDTRASGTYATVFEWTNNSGASVTVYGYYVVNPATGKVRWAERFGSPRVLAAGKKLQLQCVTTDTYEH